MHPEQLGLYGLGVFLARSADEPRSAARPSCSTTPAHKGIIIAAYGTPHPALRSRAAVVFVAAGANQFDTVAANRRFAFKPKDHYKFRIVRRPEGVTAYVDDEPVISATVGNRPEGREPNLHVVGSFGKEGTVIFVDNMEIRVPADKKYQPWSVRIRTPPLFGDRPLKIADVG